MLQFLNMLFFVCLLLASLNSIAQSADTIRPGKGHLQARLLKSGLRQYLVCYEDPKKNRSLGFWYWLRDIRQEERNGKPVIVIAQRWYGSDTLSYQDVYSINDATDFAPVYHRETARGKIGAYDWKATGITGADTVEG